MKTGLKEKTRSKTHLKRSKTIELLNLLMSHVSFLLTARILAHAQTKFHLLSYETMINMWRHKNIIQDGGQFAVSGENISHVKQI